MIQCFKQGIVPVLYSSLELWPVLLVQKRNCCYFIGDKYLPCVGNDVCMYSPRGINVYFSWIWLILRGNSLCIICSFPNSTIVHAMKKWNLLLKRSNVFCELVHYSYRRLLLSTGNRSFDLSISYERQVGVSFNHCAIMLNSILNTCCVMVASAVNW